MKAFIGLATFCSNPGPNFYNFSQNLDEKNKQRFHLNFQVQERGKCQPSCAKAKICINFTSNFLAEPAGKAR